MGTAWTASRHLKVPLKLMEDFQQRYCRGPSCAYPGISRYWQWIAQQLQQHAVLETPFGQKRHFFGRPGDDATIREAIAFMPQSTTARRTQLALWRIWKKMPHVRILAETYDSVTFEFPQHCDEHEVVEQALELMRVTLRRPDGSQYVVPGEAKTGWNWGNVTMQSDIDAALRRDGRPPRLNLDGLKKFNPKVGDSRQRQVGLQRQPLA
jgi:DNA polymerase I-like protein with 3'-5' exonuclease and polymerase domains